MTAALTPDLEAAMRFLGLLGGDVDEASSSIFSAAKKAKRAVGVIQRQIGGSSTSPTCLAQVALALLSSLVGCSAWPLLPAAVQPSAQWERY